MIKIKIHNNYYESVTGKIAPAFPTNGDVICDITTEMWNNLNQFYNKKYIKFERIQ